MPRDAMGNIIPGSYNPDGSINQAVMDAYYQKQRGIGPMRAPGSSIPARPTNPSPAAAAQIRQMQRVLPSR